MIDINLYKAMLGKARFDIDVRCVAYRYNMHDILISLLESDELFLKNNYKVLCLFNHRIIPSTSYFYYDKYINCNYIKPKRIPRRLINNIRRKIGM